MAISNNIRPGRHFLQIPGPTNVPDRVLRAMDYPTIDHRGPDFAELGLRVLDRIKLVFKTSEPVIIFPASGTGAWEAALVNTLSAGDKILMFETGHFSTLWWDIAQKFFVDTISSLGSIDYRHEEWKVDVTVGGSQKGLLLPPGLSFNAISSKALEAYKTSELPKSYWDWGPMLENNKKGYFPYTPATNLFYGLDEAINMLTEEGLDNVFKRHKRFAEATRVAVKSWGLEILCKNPDEYSDSLTAVMVPDGHDADFLRKTILDHYNMSLGTGLAKVAGKIFRIGHLGDFNELMLAGTLAGVEMGLMKSNIPYKKGGILKALEYLC